ncbi:signal peptidase I [Arthrobacter glacialis]|nr:signal peptidase I [Arthrobacter glacialis]
MRGRIAMSAATQSTPRSPDDDAATVAEVSGESGSTSSGWVLLVVATLARTALIFTVSLAAWSSLPVLLGWEPTTVMSGSMEPRIFTGDVVVVRPVDPTEYKSGRVVLAEDPDQEGRLRLHRVVRQDDTGALVLRGDANATDDASTVSPDAVHGVGFLRIPYAGLPGYWFNSAQWLKLALLAGTLVLLCWATTLDRALQRSRHRGDPPERGAGTRSSDSPAGRPNADGGLAALGLGGETGRAPTAFRARPTGRRSLRAGTAAVVVSALVLGTVPVAAQAAYTSTTVNATNSFAANTFFRCSPAVLAASPSTFYQFNADADAAVADSVTPGAGNGTFQGVRPAAPANNGACADDGGNAATFDGSTNSITTPVQGMAAPQVFSYEMWFRTTTTSGGKLMSFVTPQNGAIAASDNRVLYMFNNGQLRFGLTPDTVQYLTTPAAAGAFNNGKWHHVAATMSSAGIKLFVDGVRTNFSAGVTSGPVTTGSWIIGTGPGNTWTTNRTSAFYQGELDDVAIYNGKALTDSEVAAHYAAGRASGLRP